MSSDKQELEDYIKERHAAIEAELIGIYSGDRPAPDSPRWKELALEKAVLDTAWRQLNPDGTDEAGH